MSIEQHISDDDHWFTNTDHDFDFEVYQDDDETRQNIVGWTLRLFVKRRRKDPDSAAVLTVAAIVTDGAQGECTASVLAAQSRLLPAGIYFFEMKRMDTGEKTTLTHGTATLHQSLDRAA